MSVQHDMGTLVCGSGSFQKIPGRPG